MLSHDWFSDNILKYPYYRSFYNSLDPSKTMIKMYVTAFLLSSFMNAILFIDLYIGVRNPFYPRKKRYPRYFLTFVITFIATLYYLNINTINKPYS